MEQLGTILSDYMMNLKNKVLRFVDGEPQVCPSCGGYIRQDEEITANSKYEKAVHLRCVYWK